MKLFRLLAAVCAVLALAVVAEAGGRCGGTSSGQATAGHYERVQTTGVFGRVRTKSVWVPGTVTAACSRPAASVPATVHQTVYPSAAVVNSCSSCVPGADNIRLPSPLPTDCQDGKCPPVPKKK